MSDPFTPTYELENPTINFFNMVDFRRFLVENKVIVTAVSFTIATYINELVRSFYDNLIFSFFEKEDPKSALIISLFLKDKYPFKSLMVWS